MMWLPSCHAHLTCAEYLEPYEVTPPYYAHSTYTEYFEPYEVMSYQAHSTCTEYPSHMKQWCHTMLIQRARSNLSHITQSHYTMLIQPNHNIAQCMFLTLQTKIPTIQTLQIIISQLDIITTYLVLPKRHLLTHNKLIYDSSNSRFLFPSIK